jgi:phosphoribosylformimino-5-aminoimidazole carboxamide ribotide isomerase
VRLYPAVDILGGSAVRLTRGDFHSGKVYDEDPLQAAQAFADAGAQQLHVVDLDGARSGAPANLEHLRRIVAALELPVQYGGGLRTPEAIERALDAGAQRVILGTAAFEQPELLSSALERHGPERVLVSIDARGGTVATDGWTRAGTESTAAAARRLIGGGVRELVYTDVERDGMLTGPDLEGLRELALTPGAQLLYSGGVGSLADLERLAALQLASLAGVIVGKALYEGRFTIEQAHAALAG